MVQKPSARDVDAIVFRAEAGSLYVVATPIGNLRDAGLRALDILRTADIIAAEDTRVTAQLLAHYGIATRARALHEHNELARIPALLGELAAGRSIALVSDAGTPAISDPGARLVRAALDAGHRVVPIPGASAIAAAVSAAGLSAARFAFVGFLPLKAKERAALIAVFAKLPAALVLFEAPHRVVSTVTWLAQTLGGTRRLVVARELTKAFESIASLALADAPAWFAGNADRQRGEFVLIVDAAEPDARNVTADAPIDEDAERMLSVLLDELPPSRAAHVAAQLTGAPRDALYARAVVLRERQSP
jgi:16S rRNA (cytidine1402-2'-O)-methyltransferase